jgi:hypothetical protein
MPALMAWFRSACWRSEYIPWRIFQRKLQEWQDLGYVFPGGIDTVGLEIESHLLPVAGGLAIGGILKINRLLINRLLSVRHGYSGCLKTEKPISCIHLRWRRCCRR